MKEQLIELLNTLFQRDNEAITDIVEKFDYKEEDYVRPPENVEELAESLLEINQPDINCAFSHGHIHTEETKSNGLNLPEGTIELWFKFFDVRTRRRKIFRTGDYYMRLINTGFDKWSWLFYIKLPKVDGEAIITEYALAQHPHISRGQACLAGMETGIRASINNYNFNGFLWRMRTFLDSWNYRSPHHNPERFEYPKIFKYDDIKTMFDKTGESHTRIFNMNSWALENNNIGYQFDSLMLTSARKKAYDPEPASRALYHLNVGTHYLDGDKVEYSRLNNIHIILYNLAHWIEEHIDNTEGLTMKELLILAHYMVNNFFNKAKIVSKNIEGTWTENHSDMSASWYRAVESWYHNRDKINESPGRYGHTHNNYVWYLSKQEDNPNSWEECRDMIQEIHDMRDRAEGHRNDLEYDEPSMRVVRRTLLNEFAGIFKDLNDIEFENESEFIRWVNNWTLDSGECSNIDDVMNKYQERFLAIKKILDGIYNELVIEYHETELRRLTNGKERRQHTVQIENLNL